MAIVIYLCLVIPIARNFGNWYLLLAAFIAPTHRACLGTIGLVLGHKGLVLPQYRLFDCIDSFNSRNEGTVKQHVSCMGTPLIK